MPFSLMFPLVLEVSLFWNCYGKLAKMFLCVILCKELTLCFPFAIAWLILTFRENGYDERSGQKTNSCSGFLSAGGDLYWSESFLISAYFLV